MLPISEDNKGYQISLIEWRNYENTRLRLALQNWLSKECINLLEKWLKIQAGNHLIYSPKFPVRFINGSRHAMTSLYQMVYDAGIVGEDVFLEQLFSSNGAEDLEIVIDLA